jgi:uncharacterized protein with PIN domain
MLGKLARWLRMLGQDTAYSITLNDKELLDNSQRENRILITSDYDLYQKSKKSKAKAFYIKGQKIEFLLSNLSKTFEFPLIINMETSRCPKCNILLKRIPKKEVVNKIKPNTLIQYNKFWLCSQCSSIYWQGSHWKKINSTLQKASKL